MSQAKSLAEFLGANEPGAERQERPLRKQSIREFCKGILESQEYRDSIVRRIMFDALPAQIEQLIYYYAEGKPIERLEVDSNPSGRFENLTSAEVEAKAAHLWQLSRTIRQLEERRAQGQQGESEETSSAVH